MGGSEDRDDCFCAVSAARRPTQHAFPEASQASDALCLRCSGAQELRSQARGTVSLQRLSQRSSQVAVAWLRSAGGTTHSEPTLLENASQPSAAVRNQIFLVPILFGRRCTVWEGADRGAHLRTLPARCVQSASSPVRRSRPATIRIECRQDPPLLVGCGQF